MEQDMEYYRRYLKGDADALGELMKLYRERLIFFAMEFLSSPDDAEEVAAECFAELALHPLRYRFGSSVKTYLFAIARNKALTLCRKQTRHRLVPLETAANIAGGASPEELFLREESARQLHCALNGLREDYRIALHLLYFEELSYEQAAKVMKKSRKQIDNLAYRAKLALKARLEKEGMEL